MRVKAIRKKRIRVRSVQPSQKRRTEYLHHQLKGLVAFVASKVAKKYPVPREELEEVGHDILVDLLMDWERYDAAKGAPSTYVHKQIYWRLSTYCIRKRPEISFAPELHRVGTERPWLVTFMLGLDSDAREMLEILFHLKTTSKVRPNFTVKTRSRSREMLLLVLLARGWDRDKIERVWSEITEALDSPAPSFSSAKRSAGQSRKLAGDPE